MAHSVLGRTWRSRCDARADAHALAITQAHGTSDLLARVLAGRGVVAADLPVFLEPKLRDLLPDPAVLRDMGAAATRLADAVVAGEHVAIFGDYDVDGACSAALLAGYLNRCGTPHAVHIPDRITEGYGPNGEAIRALRASGASLLVTVDCGTTSHEPLAVAHAVGFDTIVLDHHQAPEALPRAAALVNPNRQDDLSGLGHLAAAGVVFLTLIALNRELRRRGFWQSRGAEPDLLADLDLVALATVADVVRLEGLNRALVRQGLQVMRQRRRPGLTALLDVANLKGPPLPWHLGFLIGPRINAGGRIGDAALGARLLLTADAGEAGALAASLDALNRERQAIEQVAVEEALAQADAMLERDPGRCVLVAASSTWHPGIVGLVAARMKERFQRPAFAFALNPDGGGTGSGRSVAGVDLGRAVRHAVEAGAAVKGGGHAMAAGVTIAPGAAGDFAAFIGGSLAGSAGAGVAAELAVDAVLTAGGAQAELVSLLDQAGPFGSGNPEPTFAFARHRLVEAADVGAAHVRFKLKSGDGSVIGGVAFRTAGQPLGLALKAHVGRLVHAAGSLTVDRWGGRERVDLRLQDLATADT
ncbi:single-stranded-DNA-specific exonuclease [Chelatococcus reniformis]|uniref:Single-stranded-DNA-specific exonuclease RecJ n=1 Tax=Chelatococcus reniformis TaxID=1494448 RepID=A0A916UGE6_9HYPH|nr:single-stranded-DNA-specific exonuclease [Chelatococcus reniformis]